MNKMLIFGMNKRSESAIDSSITRENQAVD
jgi:hypothetical protein